MTDRLYYHDSFLYEFDARVIESLERKGRQAVVLDRTAFYPTSGGQIHDTGRLVLNNQSELPVTEVLDEEDGRIFHFLPGETFLPIGLAAGDLVHGAIESGRRKDHMQQHSGQHVLSAAFVRLFNIPTISFHMGAESCTIDLETNTLSAPQLEAAEKLANEVVTEDRQVSIRFVSLEEAKQLGLRKLPPKQKGEIRLIDVSDFDLTACGGTHVRSTGQIGAILLRKTEKAKQGVRVEFVCGARAVATASKDYASLTEAAALYSSHIYDVAGQIRKAMEESKAEQKAKHKLMEEVAEMLSVRMLDGIDSSPRVITSVFAERETVFVKLLAQKLTQGTKDVVALLAALNGAGTLIFARSPEVKCNMGQLMKEALAKFGGRGGGSPDLAQGGLPQGFSRDHVDALLQEAVAGFWRSQGH